MLSFTFIFSLAAMLGTVYSADNPQSLRPQGCDDHSWMMYASVSALSDKDREYLEPELELLIHNYTHFPDMNWSNYGEWGGWSGFPNSERTPNIRREWGISYACGYNPVSKEGKPLQLHGFAPECYDGIRELFPKIVELLSKGKHGDAVRVIGTLSHSIQDASTFPHMQAIHRASSFSYDKINIPDYMPVNLGDSPKQATDALIRRTEEMIHFTEKVALDIRKAMLQNDWERDQELRVQCCNEAAKVVADLIHTVIILGGEKPERKPYPFNTNLVINGNVEEADSNEPSPAGWVACWNDPKDRMGVLDWEGRVSRNQNLWRSGRRSLKIMWSTEKGLEWRQTWPIALLVTPGEHYQASAWAKTKDATGKNVVAIEFYKRNTDLIKVVESPSIDGDQEWTQLSVKAEVPAQAERMRGILRSYSNDGAVWFDDIELVHIDPTAVKTEFISEPKPEDRVMYLSFDEGKGTNIPDRSVFSGINGPNISASAGVPYDLHTSEGRIGSALTFDGIDDFAECPAHTGMDVQCPQNAMTLSLWIWVADYRDAVIACKEQYQQGQHAKGYRLMLMADGRLRFIIHTDVGDEFADSSGQVQLQKWVHISAVRTANSNLIVYMDGNPGHVVQSVGIFMDAKTFGCAPSSLYLGADTGVRSFFAGKIDEFLLFNRDLSRDEILAQIQSAK